MDFRRPWTSAVLIALLAAASIGAANAARPRLLSGTEAEPELTGISGATQAPGTTHHHHHHHQSHTGSGTQPVDRSGYTPSGSGYTPSGSETSGLASGRHHSHHHHHHRNQNNSSADGDGSQAAGGTCNGTPKIGSYGGERDNGGVNSYEATCQSDKSNLDCTPCTLWREAQAHNVCQKQPENCQNGFWVYDHLALPTTPVRGIDDMVSGSPLVDKAEIWKQAWEHAVKERLMTDDEGVLVVNSANYRTEHQMHLHMSRIDRTFAKSCVAGVKPGSSFAAASDFQCSVPLWVHNNCKTGPNCYDGWELQGTKPATIKAIEVSSLTSVWADYVRGGGSSRPGGADAWHTGLAVTRAPGSSSRWYVIAFSSESPRAPGGVGDHEICWEH